jgi:hypothetical protein
MLAQTGSQESFRLADNSFSMSDDWADAVAHSFDFSEPASLNRHTYLNMTLNKILDRNLESNASSRHTAVA